MKRLLLLLFLPAPLSLRYTGCKGKAMRMQYLLERIDVGIFIGQEEWRFCATYTRLGNCFNYPATRPGKKKNREKGRGKKEGKGEKHRDNKETKMEKKENKKNEERTRAKKRESKKSREKYQSKKNKVNKYTKEGRK